MFKLGVPDLLNGVYCGSLDNRQYIFEVFLRQPISKAYSESRNKTITWVVVLASVFGSGA